MNNTGKLAGKTLFITGSSRGIGKQIGLKAARDGANIVVAAKSKEPHPKLEGTIYTAAEEIVKAGGKAHPVYLDVRDEANVRSAIQEGVDKFGGIDILVNNASAISLTGTLATQMKRYDLMHHVNTRGTFMVSKECLPFLLKSKHAHILNLSPPLNLNPKWFGPHAAYTMAKYGMSMCVLGMAKEFSDRSISINALWPATVIHTAAIRMLTGPESEKWSRKPDIVADAAYAILIKDPGTATGKFFIDEEVLQDNGVTDLKQYACDPTNVANLMRDLFLDDDKYSGKAIGQLEPDESETIAGGISKLFKKIESLLSADIVKKVQAVFEIRLTGEEEGTWFLDLKNGTGACGKGSSPTPPDAVLTMKSNIFTRMFAGKVKAAAAFMAGKLKISGDLQKAMKLEKLLQELKFKL